MTRNSIARETRTSSSTNGIASDESGSGPDKPASVQGTLEADSLPTAEWTDEKHSLYLKSMEASFVNQLYNSMDTLGWSSRQEKLSTESHVNSPSTSGQFKVHRGGYWQRINFERSKSQINRTNECHDFLANPWVQRFRYASKHQCVTSPILQENAASTGCALATTSKQLHLCDTHKCHQDMVCSNAEVSDQNFVDDGVEGDNRKVKNNPKRTKTLIPGVSGNDQVVPLRGAPTRQDVPRKCISASRNITCSSEWKAEDR
ncbi:cold regulated protein [Quillaja saponaria]|uniref:Cold regulated protein n=1 Tax=Quillaja saponaria TaxID=32244 RepID=A0AAD7LYF4_QUISA|nr:cold regulated protein [Quillaja saponaria]